MLSKLRKFVGLGWILAALQTIYKFLEFVVGRAGDFDFVWSQSMSPTWTKSFLVAILDFLSYLPAWAPIVVLLACTIFLGVTRNRRAVVSIARLADKTVFLLRKAMESQVWITEESALSILQKSAWAWARQQQSEPRQSYADLFAFGVDPAKRVRVRMFADWCKKALKGFRERREEDSREKNGQWEYDEKKLRDWLDEKYEHDVISTFGDI